MGKNDKSVGGQCSMCPYVSDEQNLAEHMLIIHKVVVKKPDLKPKKRKINNTAPCFSGAERGDSDDLLNLTCALSLVSKDGSSVEQNRVSYTCDICVFNTDSVISLTQHIEDKHNALQIYSCKHCEYSSGIYDMAIHYVNTHTNVTLNMCILCLYISHVKTDVITHLGDVHRPVLNQYECVVCSKQFKKLSVLLEHTKIKHSFTVNDIYKLIYIRELSTYNIFEENRIENNIKKDYKSIIHFSDLRIAKYSFINYFTPNFPNKGPETLLLQGNLDGMNCKESFGDIEMSCINSGGEEFSVKMGEDIMINNYDRFETEEENVTSNVVDNQDSGTLIYMCEQCPYFTHSPNCLEEHQNKQHGDDCKLQVSQPDNTKRNYCRYCTYSTLDEMNFGQHLKDKHNRNDNNIFKCLLCAYTCDKQSSLNDHRHAKHKQVCFDIKNVVTPPVDVIATNNVEMVKTNVQNPICSDSTFPVTTQPLTDIFLVCKYCDYSTLNEMSLAQHLESKHNGNDHHIFKCLLCSYSSDEQSSLNAHRNDKHKLVSTSNKNIKSPSVSANSTSDAMIKCSGQSPCRSENTSPATKPVINAQLLICKYCDYSTSNEMSLAQHLESKHNGNDHHIFKCPLCSYSSDEQSSLNAHRNDKHKLVSTSNKNIKSPSVSVNSTSDAMIKCSGQSPCRSENTSPATKPVINAQLLICKYCDYSTSNEMSLAQHLKGKHNGNDHHIFKCPLCWYSSDKQSSLNAHRNDKHKLVSTSNKNIKSPSVSANSTSDAMIKCSGQSPCRSENTSPASKLVINAQLLICKYCDYSTSNEMSLAQHLKGKHNGLNIYKCSLCSYYSDKQSSLGAHRNDKHEQIIKTSGQSPCSSSKNTSPAIKPVINGQLLICKYCDYSTLDEVSLSQHLKNKHIDPDIFKCSLCSYSSGKQSSLYAHSSAKHKLVPSNNKNIKSPVSADSTFDTMIKTSGQSPCSSENVSVLSEPVINDLFLICKYCGYSTLNSVSLAQHLRDKHNGNNTNILKCPICSYSSDKQSSLDAHKNDKHKLVSANNKNIHTSVLGSSINQKPLPYLEVLRRIKCDGKEHE